MTLEVPKEIAERVSLWSMKNEEAPDALMLRAIEQHLEDLEGLRGRSEDLRRGEGGEDEDMVLGGDREGDG